MRVRRCLGVIGVSAALMLSVHAQGQSESAGEEYAKLDDVKLLAQQAALPALSGEEAFILRESHWAGRIEPGKAKLIQVQLFRRNQYQFWLAVPHEEASLNLNLYDGNGELMEAETVTYDKTNVVSTIVEAETTGAHYIRISLKTTIDRPQEWALIYAYR